MLASRQPIRSTGNWTAAQNIEHVAVFIGWSLDGFPFRAPLPLRLIGRMLRSGALRKTPRPGIPTPKGNRAHLSPADFPLERAMASLRRNIRRVQSGERMTHPSSFFGALTHEEWIDLHCRHAELHFSFLHPA